MRNRPPHAGRQQLNTLTGQGGLALAGQSLAGRLVHEHRLPPAEAADIVAQVARLLTGIHATGQVHGDIRPATIGYAADGTITLVGAPGAGGVEGLPYLSPEQIDRRRIGPASDIYSLGAVLFELLAGRPPYAGAEPERVGTVVTVPGHLDGIATAMLAVDPAARPWAEEVATVLESGVAPPPKRIVRPDRPRRRLLSPTVLGVLMLLMLPGLVLGGWGTLRSVEAMSTVGSAAPLVRVLPASFELAFDLSLERDALRTDAPLTEDFLQVTDRSINAWTTDLDQLDTGDDAGLRRRTERTTAAVERLEEIRASIRAGDRSGRAAAVEMYTSAVNGLFGLAAELPSFPDEALARQARNLELIGPVSEVLGYERRVMTNALRNGRISDQGIAELNAAHDSWATHSASIYARAEPEVRRALDTISGRSFKYGSYAVSSQRAVIRLLNARDSEDVVRQLADGAGGRPVDQVWLADAAEFVQDLKEVIVASAGALAADIASERRDARSDVVGWVTFTAVFAVLIAAAGIALLRSRRRTAGTVGG